MENIFLNKKSFISCFLDPVNFNVYIQPKDGKIEVSLGLTIPVELPGIILPEHLTTSVPYLSRKTTHGCLIMSTASTLQEAMDYITSTEKVIMNLVTSGANPLIVAQAESKGFLERMKVLGWKKIK